MSIGELDIRLDFQLLIFPPVHIERYSYRSPATNGKADLGAAWKNRAQLAGRRRETSRLDGHASRRTGFAGSRGNGSKAGSISGRTYLLLRPLPCAADSRCRGESYPCPNHPHFRSAPMESGHFGGTACEGHSAHTPTART